MAWQRTRSLILAGLLWSASALGQSHPATFAFPPQFSTGVAAGAYLGRPFQAVTADLNHDGYGDIVTADYVAGTVMVTLGSSTGFQRPMSFPAVANPVSLAVGDFNNDGNPDVVVVGSEAVLLLGTGTGSFQPPTVISPSLASFIAAGDFNGDGNLDVAIADDGSNEVLVALGNGNGTFGSLIATPAPYPGSLYAGDFRNNGLDDLIVVQKNGDAPVFYYVSNADGTFQHGPPIMKGVSDLVAADMNADGNLDLVTIASYQNSVMVWLGDGAGNFTVAAKAPTEMESGFSLAVADVNGDGIPDVATANQDGSASIFLGMGNGKLQPPYSYPANDFPLWIGAGNYYGSDIADLAVLDGAGNHVPDISISLLRNAGSGHFAGLTDMCFIDAGSFVLADMTRWHSRLGGDGRQQFAGARGGLDPAGIGKWAIRERHR